MKENKHSLRRGNLGGLIRMFPPKRRKEEEMVTETTRRRSRCWFFFFFFFFLFFLLSPPPVFFLVFPLSCFPLLPCFFLFFLLQSSTSPASLPLAWFISFHPPPPVMHLCLSRLLSPSLTSICLCCVFFYFSCNHEIVWVRFNAVLYRNL